MFLFDSLLFTLMIVLTLTSRAVLTNKNTPVIHTFLVLFPITFLIVVMVLGINRVFYASHQ